MKQFFRMFGMVTAGVGVLLIGLLAFAGTTMPDVYRVSSEQSLSVTAMGVTARITSAQPVSSTASATASSYQAQLMLFDTIPVKKVKVDVVPQTKVIPCGTPFGIKMFTNGVVVVGTADLDSATGTVNPAAIAGIKIGDVITEVNGKAISENDEIAQAIEASNGEPLNLTFVREKKVLHTKLTPVKSSYDNTYKGGLWVRDSTAGIGTVTFFCPEDRSFGGLGHGICDNDTRDLMPMKTGEIVGVTIHDVQRGQKGSAGELRGYFTSSDPVGDVQATLETGVYGTLNASPVEHEAVEIAMKQEIKLGNAQILATVDGDTPQYYDAQIQSVDYSGENHTKNMVIRITDSKLLARTGGIVQGMSGSPVLQNGKLIGAVTHVFLNDPTQGYGIFAENMLEVSRSLHQPSLSKVS